MPRVKDPVWEYFKPNTVADAAHPLNKYPYRDVFLNLPHTDNATRAKLFLAFSVPKFREEQPAAWQKLVAGLTKENVAGRKEADRQTWRQCRTAETARVESRLLHSAASNERVNTTVADAGAYGSSTYCAGLSAANLQLSTLGKAFVTLGTDSIPKEQVDQICKLMLRWMNAKALPMNCCEGPEWEDFIKAVRPALAGRTLNYDKIRNDNMLKKQFLEITAAVKELKEKAAFHSLQLDGWTSPTKEFIFQAISVVNGTPFFETQPTSQGDKCDAAWMIKTVEPLLKDPKCAGLTCDNCSVMQDFKSAFQEFASKLNRVVFYANCQWHGADSIGAALIGEGGVATAAHVLAETTGPEAARWTMDVNNPKSIPAGCKGIVKMVTGRQRLRGMFRKLQARANMVAKAEWALAKEEAKRNNEPEPPRPKHFNMLALNGVTRKLSIVKPMVTVYANRDILDTLVRSSHFEVYLKDVKSEKRAELVKLADMVKDGTLIRRAGVMAEVFGILQLHQRMCEYDYQNLSDGLFHITEVLARIEAFDNPLITAAHKRVIKEAVMYRLEKLWTPNYALAYMLDPRRRFGATNLNLAPVCSDMKAEAYSCLEQRVKVLPADVQHKIRRHYNALTGGDVYDFVGADAEKLEAANDMNAAEWWATFHTPEGKELSKIIAQPLFSITLAQAGVERVNSAGKRIVEGRWQLHTENQRMLTGIYVNSRQLRLAHEKRFAAVKPGSFRLGAHWPPRSASLTAIALDDALEEGEVPPSTTLRDALIELLRGDEEAEAAADAADAAGAGDGAAAGSADPARMRKRLHPVVRKAAAKRAKGKEPPTCASGTESEGSGASDDDAVMSEGVGSE